MPMSTPCKQVAILTCGITCATLVFLWYRKLQKNSIPKKWKRVGEVTDLICYPIKSCGPIRVSEIECSVLGLVKGDLRDRVFMVITPNGDFVTARKYPQLVQIFPKIEENIMTLSAAGMIDISLDIKKLYTSTTFKACVWDENVEAVECGEEIAKWISRFILSEDTGLRLVFYPNALPTRGVRQKNQIFQSMMAKDSGALHDASSYMLFNESSVSDLNTRLDTQVTSLRFRPNFVIKGPKAYEEDSWRWIKIGNDVILENIKPCTRCIFTNIDPDTGNRSSEGEPLKTLKKYRQFAKTGESPVLGIHLGLRGYGKVALGDSIYIPE